MSILGLCVKNVKTSQVRFEIFRTANEISKIDEVTQARWEFVDGGGGAFSEELLPTAAVRGRKMQRARRPHTVWSALCLGFANRSHRAVTR